MPDDHALDDASSAPPVEPAEPTDGSSRGWKIAAAVAVLAAVGAVGALGALLFAGGDDPAADVSACVIDRDFTSDDGPTDAERAKEVNNGIVAVRGNGKGLSCPPKGTTANTGLVQKTTDGGFTMREVDGATLGEEVTLTVREPDRPYIEIAHAQTHASLGQPIRVYTDEVDGEEVVVYMDDPSPGKR